MRTTSRPAWHRLADIASGPDGPPTFTVDGRGHDLWRIEHELGLDGQDAATAGPSLGATASVLLLDVTDGQVDAIATAWRTGRPLVDPFIVRTSPHSSSCSRCAGHGLSFDGFTFTATDPCPFPDGFEVVVRLEIPSGRMRVGNDFRPWFDVEQTPNVNEAHGIAQLTREMAEQGVLHAFVGNACPGLYRTAPDLDRPNHDAFVIGSPGDDGTLEPDAFGERLATIVTDLWWTSIADGDEFDRRGCEAPAETVAVTPGVYEMRYLGLVEDTDPYDASPTVYATIVRVGDC